VNLLDALRQAPLHKAAITNNVESARVLLEYGGAKASLGDRSQTTPLLLAAEMGKAAVLRYMVDRDPSLMSSANESLWTALHLAAHGKEMKRSSQIEAKFATCVKALLDAKAAIDAQDEDRKTPLHRSATTGNHESTAELIRQRADIEAVDNCRWTPMHYAVQEGNLDCVKQLIAARAAVQKLDSSCLTPLAVAVMENQVKAAELLVKAGADPNLRSKGLASPMMLARKEPKKCSEILSLFELGFISHA